MPTNFPKYPTTNHQERRGINAVAEAMARAGLIWRETPMADVGIDGQIEYVNPEGFATGRIIAVQVKSGPSFFKEKENTWIFYPEEKHLFYWERFPLPVLIILHNPDTGMSYWQDIRHALRSTTPMGKGLLIPNENILQHTKPDVLFEGFAISDQKFMDLDEILHHMINTQNTDASFPLSYFDLFCNGLTNICRSLYFSIDVAVSAAEIKLAAADAPTGIGMGYNEHNFLFGYTGFLVHQHIADIDYSDCLIDWYDRELQPSFLAPLTSRGRMLVELIQETQVKYQEEGKLSDYGIFRAAQEGLVRMVFDPTHIRRAIIISELQEVYKRSQGKSI